MIDFIDKTSEKAGTPLNRSNLMAVQGFQNTTTVFNTDGTIVETNTDNPTEKVTTTFNADGSITETFVGEKTITKTTTFGDTGITEVLS